MPRGRERSLTVLPPKSLVKESARNRAWKLHLKGKSPDTIADLFAADDDYPSLSPAAIQKLINETYKVQRGILARESADDMALYVARQEMLLDRVMSELDTEDSMRDAYLAGEYDLETVVGQGLDGPVTAVTGTRAVKFNHPALLQLASQISEKIAKSQGILAEKVDIKVESTHLEARLNVVETNAPGAKDLIAAIRASLADAGYLGSAGPADGAAPLGLPGGPGEPIEGELGDPPGTEGPLAR